MLRMMMLAVQILGKTNGRSEKTAGTTDTTSVTDLVTIPLNARGAKHLTGPSPKDLNGAFLETFGA